MRLRPERSGRWSLALVLAGTAGVGGALLGLAAAPGFTNALYSASAGATLPVGTRDACTDGVSYQRAVAGASPAIEWRFAQPRYADRGQVEDSSGHRRSGSVTGTDLGTGVGLPECDKTRALVLPGGASRSSVASPAVAVPGGFTLLLWIRVAPGSSGSLAGLSDTPFGPAPHSDRTLAIGSDGRVSFTLGEGSAQRSVTSSRALHDGTTHLVAASVSGAGGAALYVDGEPVGADLGPGTGVSYPGRSAAAPRGMAHWRVGWLGAGPQAAATVDDFVVLASTLTAADAAALYEQNHW